MQVTVRNLSKSFASSDGDVQALHDLEFTIEAGEFYTLLGPSGCGKSTTLRCVAGLERADAGEIRIGDRVVVGPGISLPANERPIGMVFQSYAIWPHMSVFNNVAFPLKQRKNRVPRAKREARVMEALALVQMEELAHRPAPYLSGGQQQRVALARALVSRPDVLLLDEPLSNLDAKLREELRIEIKKLTERLGITTLYVTHDQIEALAMSDRIAVMLQGQILQEGSSRDIYLHPATSFVAQFVGQVNFFEGQIADAPAAGLGAVTTEHGTLRCAVPAGIGKGAAVSVAVRPEHMRAHAVAKGAGAVDPADGNIIEGEVELAVFLGDSIDCQVQVGSRMVRAKLDQVTDIEKGGHVVLSFAPEFCVVFPHAPET
jgi:iron(III) transport system ATP-binding protein